MDAQSGETDWGNVANNVNALVGAGTSVLAGNYGLTANQTFRYASGGQSAKALSAAHSAHSLKVAGVLGKVSLVGGIIGTGVSISNIATDY